MKLTMTSAYPSRQASFSGTRIRRGVKPYLLALLLGAALADGLRRKPVVRLLPKCQVDKPQALNATAVVTRDAADSRLTEVTGFGSNPGALKMFT